MKLVLFSTMLMLISAASRADLNTVSVPATMIHASNAALGLGYSGKVEYSLAPGAYDSVFVTLIIVSQSGGTPLTLTEVSGDVGAIAVNVNTPAAAKTYSIFFQVDAPPGGVSYVAHIIANAAVSNTQTDIQARIAALPNKSIRANLCGDLDKFTSNSATGVPSIFMNDGPYGWNFGWEEATHHSTSFPTCVNEGCTWDTALARLQGKTKAEEWRAMGRNCALGVGMNLIYHPLDGRSAEYVSEDPYLSGHIAAADAMGLEDNGVIPTIKHFACNNVELQRSLGENATFSSERTLQELFLYNWIPAVRVTWAVMAAYNKVNGVQACANKYLLTDVLRKQWGYRSLVMSDWQASYVNADSAVRFGIDMGTNWTAPWDNGYITVMGNASDSLVNMHLSRILYAHEKVGDLAAGYKATAFATSMESAAHKAVARIVGTNSIVLAKNTGKILPMALQGKTIAVLTAVNSNFGGIPFATVCQPGIHGSSNVYPSVSISYVQGITSLLAAAGAGASTVVQNPTAAQLNSADYILVFVGISGETEGSDRSSAALGDAEGEAITRQALAATNGTAKTIVIYSGGSPSIAGSWSSAPGVVIAHFPGDQQGAALADILFGKFNPCGKLSVSFPADNTQLPPYEDATTYSLAYASCDQTHGYFRQNKLGQTPLFAFGYGLSYTTFQYSNLQIFPVTISAGDRIHVRVSVQNLGTNPAATPDTASEVVQLYLSMPATTGFPVRVQDLRGFSKVTLTKGGPSKTVDFVLSAEDMQIFNPNGDYSGNGVWFVPKGTYGVRVGTSSQITMQPTLSGSFIVQ